MFFEFRKSSYSGGGGAGTCVEVALNLPDHAALRDSKNPRTRPLIITRTAFTSLITAIKDDHYPTP